MFGLWVVDVVFAGLITFRCFGYVGDLVVLDLTAFGLAGGILFVWVGII